MYSGKILPEMILRTPYYPQQKASVINLNSALKNPVFQSSIFLASKSLYRELKTNNFELQELSTKALFSVQKYFNRMCYRTTPFGSFSSFSFIEEDSEQGKIVIPDQSFKLHLFPNIITIGDTTAYLNNGALFYTNYSIYRTSSGIRYLKYAENENKRRDFTIENLNKNKALEKVFVFCRKKRAKIEIKTFLTHELSLDPFEADELFDQLIAKQLLIHHPVSPEPKKKDNERSKTTLYNKLSNNNPTAYKTMSIHEFSNIPELEIKNPGEPQSSFYANLERPAVNGIPNWVYGPLQESLAALEKLTSMKTYTPLDQFKKNFMKRFEGKPISILHALDPEIGISYEDLAVDVDQNKLISDVNFQKNDDEDHKINWGPINQLLMKKWPNDRNGFISLNKADLSFLPESKESFSPSFSVMFKIVGEKIVIESAGGNSATALIGRFTLFNKKIWLHSKAIANTESALNKNVIFAEMIFDGEGATDNINRRKQIRQYEIPVFGNSDLPDSKQIKMSELFLSMENDELILWSTRLKKRIIPRLSSAYNFKINNLPIIRFLGDLQYQGLKTNWTLDLPSLFPNLEYYPRITYQNSVLFLSTWILTKEQFKEIFLHQKKEQIVAFLKLANSIALSKRFTLNNGDQYLTFDLEDEESLHLMLYEIKWLEKIVFKECIAEPDFNGLVLNEEGLTFNNQFIASVVRQEETYVLPYTKPTTISDRKLKKDFIIGTEWLYFKIYCKYFNSNEILLALAQKIDLLKRKKYIYQWFFVRYNDPAYHLRVRFHINQEHIGEVIAKISQTLNKLKERVKIINFQTDTYQRELNRYPAPVIALVERIFCLDTELTMRFFLSIKHSSIPRHGYELALVVAYNTITFCISDNEKRLEYLSNVKNMFFSEFGGGNELKIQLDKKKREMKLAVTDLLTCNDFFSSSNLSKQHTDLLDGLSSLMNKEHINEKLLGDIVHMQINRAFNDKNRENELIVYTLLYQFELMLKRRKEN